MKVLDPGHDYLLATIDGGEPQRLTFVKRDTPPAKYPGNVGHYPGVIIQEVLRVLIDRVEYLQGQAEQMGDGASYADDARLLAYLRKTFLVLENRTRRKRGQPLAMFDLSLIETYPACPQCGHILCLEHREAASETQNV